MKSQRFEWMMKLRKNAVFASEQIKNFWVTTCLNYELKYEVKYKRI